ncbi:uncharacterized protein BX663DRAFT_524272 [Cokeromyces recurvatus]|uniref:uncharacterized protein n=1 Tax=Cokeromyces recurvatus TaxID=90255 RepID=UPI00221F958A|nr:uncharacterized protein BX663DRAFT_524272 [Cokeromyces recurvatus]KAI7898654.1 hypothetical protein BX663DRAFT_524272 [Cokeromyces recurvatus]
MDSTLLIKNASGKQFSLLNNEDSKVNSKTSTLSSNFDPRRKYHCNEAGCNKSFTTSGHLARHNRIHTGEKNFHCLHPGCPSRFSRQDNMMQHYRTHLCQKMRRQYQKKNTKDMGRTKKKPQLFCHSYYGREDESSLQPLTASYNKTITPHHNLPYSKVITNRPKRALSTSSTASSSSTFSSTSMPYYHDQLQPDHDYPYTLLPPPPFIPYYPQHIQPEDNECHQYHEWIPNTQKSLSNLLHLANIVSTFG